MALDHVNNLQQAVTHAGEAAFDIVPKLLERVIKDELWKGRLDQHGEPFKSFEAFAEHPLWEGLDKTTDDLLTFCHKHPEVQALINAEVRQPADHGTNQHTSGGDNVTSSSDRGNDATYALRRLKRDNPELAERVVKGEMSAHAAAIQAGFRRHTIQVPADPERAARALARHFSPEDLRIIANIITQP